MKLIFIHGRAQGGKDPKALKKTWTDTFINGLQKSGLSLPISQDNIILPYYGDILDDLVAKYQAPIEDVIQKGQASAFQEPPFLGDFLNEIAANADISQAELQAAQTAVMVEKGPLNWKWVHTILKAIDRNTKWSEASIKRFTYDVFLYLSIDKIKLTINDLVLHAMDDEPCVVVGHSLGSVVSYNILRDHPNFNVKQYITVGSPLGVNAVKKYLKIPIMMPACVQKGWYNAFDNRDVVALKPLDQYTFPIHPSITNNDSIHNQTDNRHGIEGYLNDATVAKTIYNALKG